MVAESRGASSVVQFHPAYSYEDFIQGLRPKAVEGGGIEYPMIAGRFLECCKEAERTSDPYVLVIDEINRANLARVFGELMYLLEYRDENIPLAGGSTLKVPANLYIIGTMNTADRSIALVDHALRRRFAFIELEPNYDYLAQFHEESDFGPKAEHLVSLLKEINEAIGDKHYALGTSFFLATALEHSLEDIWLMEIEPYLEEFFFDKPDTVTRFRWEAVGERFQ